MMVGNYLSEIFGKSPVRPMEKHMDKVLSCVIELSHFIDAVIDNNMDKRNQLQQRIIEIENEADVLKKKLRMHLPNTLFMPVSRRDLLEVLTMQDKLAGTARDICAVIVNRNLQIPAAIQTDYCALVECSIAACKQAQVVVNELDELLETGFGVNELERMQGLLEQLDLLEHDADTIETTVMGKLYAIEADLNPVDAVFLYRLVELTGRLADRAQQVGSRLQLMLAK